MRISVRVNCPSINPVAAEAPTGSHQVLATKKYVLAKVISQITTSNARPIPQSSQKTNGKNDKKRRETTSVYRAQQHVQRSAASLPQALEDIAQEKISHGFHGCSRINQTP